MITPEGFCDLLLEEDYRFFAGVPCSVFRSAIDCMIERESFEYVAAANEGTALAIATGARLAGRKAALMLQSSGIGNLVNPLTSLCQIYEVPVPIFVSARAFPDGKGDEPQHEVMGRALAGILEACDVPFFVLPPQLDAFGETFRRFERDCGRRSPYVVLIPPGSIGAHPGTTGGWSGPLRRARAVQLVADFVGPDDVVVSTTARISRELFSLRDRPGNFYMQGSMGHASSIALGVALARPDCRVFVIDGDGAALMHLGAFSTNGHYGPPNLVHIVLDNEAYESTGSQTTTSSTTRLEEVARACSYARSRRCVNEQELQKALDESLPGPTCIVAKVDRRSGPDLPRITERYSVKDTSTIFRSFLSSTRRDSR